MTIFSRTIIPILLAAAMLASCNSVQSTPTLSQVDRMETAISTVSTALAETQRAVPTTTPMTLATSMYSDIPTISFFATRLPPPTPFPSPTLGPTSTPPTATRGNVQTLTGNDGMTLLYVPAGEFTMGSDADDALAECQKFRSDCQRSWFTQDEPPHSVHVDAFWIDQTEVTNKMYALCVEAGVCQDPTSTGFDPHSRYYGNPEFDNYPVIFADWSMAKTYCEWAGRRLPTEAEWEKAARGENASVYPWGDTFDGSLVNFCDTNCPSDWANKSFNDGFADVAPVGSYPSGKSVYGALDMAGNVLEWVSSLYKPYPYDATDGRENLDSSDARVLRGGSWSSFDYNVRSANRDQNYPSGSYVGFGFRCSRSP